MQVSSLVVTFTCNRTLLLTCRRGMSVHGKSGLAYQPGVFVVINVSYHVSGADCALHENVKD
jgi:hypothetical protein